MPDLPFDVISHILQVETIASGRRVRRRRQLIRLYGRGAWKKKKGVASVRLDDGTVVRAEVHWYEARGIGRKDFKVKHVLD